MPSWLHPARPVIALLPSGVSVSMGPRNKRRLTAAAVAVAVAAATAAAITLWGSHNHTGPPGSSSSGHHSTSHSEPWSVTNHRLFFGMPMEKVERVAGGRPTEIQGRCLIYRPTVGTYDGLPSRKVGALWLGQPGSDAARTADAIKLCFYDGVLSEEYIHTQTLLGWEWVPTTL